MKSYLFKIFGLLLALGLVSGAVWWRSGINERRSGVDWMSEFRDNEDGVELPVNYLLLSDNETSIVVLARLEEVYLKGDKVGAEWLFVDHEGVVKKVDSMVNNSNMRMPFMLIIQKVPDLFPTSDEYRFELLEGERLAEELMKARGEVLKLTIFLDVPEGSGGREDSGIEFFKSHSECNRSLYRWLRGNEKFRSCEVLVTQAAVYEK